MRLYTAERTPTARTASARVAKSAVSSAGRPNSLTSSAPDTLKRSVIVVFMDALRFICCRVRSCSRPPTRLVGTMNSGSSSSVITAKRQSRKMMAAPFAISVTTFETTEPRVPVTARWAPITSLFMRLVSAPVCARVKNDIGSRCTWSNSETRRS